MWKKSVLAPARTRTNARLDGRAESDPPTPHTPLVVVIRARVILIPSLASSTYALSARPTRGDLSLAALFCNPFAAADTMLAPRSEDFWFSGRAISSSVLWPSVE